MLFCRYHNILIFIQKFLKHFKNQKVSHFRFLWVLASLTMLLFLIYVAYLLLADYLQYSSYEQLSFSEVSSLLLPACKQLLLSNGCYGMSSMGHVGHGACWACWAWGMLGMGHGLGHGAWPGAWGVLEWLYSLR